MDGHTEKNLPPAPPESLAKRSDAALFILLRTPVPVELVVASALCPPANILLLATEIDTASVAINTPISHVSATDTDSDVKLLIGLLDPPEQPDELARLPGYRLMRVLGVGGMGIVFQAEDLKLNRQVAIKLIRPKRFKDKHATQRFLTEARSAAKLTNDHIVTVHHVGQHGDIPYLVMQLLTGQSLADRLRRDGNLDVLVALQIARQIAQGLAAAHAEGMLHRDIKPDNIWLEASSGRVKILDFGLAQLVLPNTDTAAEAFFAGTPNYIAPERIRGQPGDSRSDLFSLGVVIYEMLSGQRPFQASGVTGTLQLGIQHDPEPLPALSAPFDSPTRALIGKLLEKDPQHRTADATELVEWIDRILVLGGLDLISRAERGYSWKWTLGICLAALIAIAIFIWASVWQVNGTVLLEASSESMSSLDDLDFIVRDQKTGERYATQLGEMKLAPGAYEFEPSQIEGVKFSKPHFEVEAGKAVSVNLSYQPDLITLTKFPETSRLIDPVSQWSGLKAWTLDTRYHQGRVLSLDTNFDGRWLATGAEDAIIRIWSTSDISFAKMLIGHDFSVIHLQWAPDDNRLIAATYRNITLWNADSSRKIATWPADRIRRLLWAPDGSKFLAVDGNSTINIYSAENFKLIESHNGGYIDAHWCDDSKSIVAITNDGQFETRLLNSWQILTPAQLRVDPNKRNVIAAGGRICASLSKGMISAAEIESGQVLPLPVFDPNEVQDIWALARGENLMAQVGAGGQTWLKLWDAMTGEVLGEWKHTGQPIGYLLTTWNDLSKDGFVFTPRSVSELDLLRINVQSAQPAAYRVTYGLQAGTSDLIRRIDDFSFSHDGKRLAVAHSGVVDIWDAVTGAFIRECRGIGRDAQSVRWTAKDARIAVDMSRGDSDDKSIYLVDPNRDDAQLFNADLEYANGDRFDSQIFSDNGGWFLGSIGPEMTIISTANPADRRLFELALAAQESIVGRSISNDGHIAIAINQSAQRSSCLRVFDSFNQSMVCEIRLPEPADVIVWSPDSSSIVAFGISGRAQAYSAITGRPISCRPLSEPILGLAWSHDLSRLALITRSKRLIVWDLETNRKLSTCGIMAVERPKLRWHPSGDSVSVDDIWGQIVTIAADSGRIGSLMFAHPGLKLYWIRTDETISSRDGKSHLDDDIIIQVFGADGTQATIPRVAFCPNNGHYYEFVPAHRIDWKSARRNAARKILVDTAGNDRRGYLATIASRQEQAFLEQKFGLIRMVWVGGSDNAEEGQWRWITGPEGLEDDGKGRLFWTGLSAANGGFTPGAINRDSNKAAQVIDGQSAVEIAGDLANRNFSNWIPPSIDFLGEPNNSFEEDYVIWNHAADAPGVRGKIGLWNDQMNSSPRKGDVVAGYLVEYGD